MVGKLKLINSIRSIHSVHSPPLSLRNSPHNFILHSLRNGIILLYLYDKKINYENIYSRHDIRGRITKEKKWTQKGTT